MHGALQTLLYKVAEAENDGILTNLHAKICRNLISRFDAAIKGYLHIDIVNNQFKNCPAEVQVFFNSLEPISISISEVEPLPINVTGLPFTFASSSTSYSGIVYSSSNGELMSDYPIAKKLEVKPEPEIEIVVEKPRRFKIK